MVDVAAVQCNGRNSGGGVSSSVPSSPHATKRAAIMAIAMVIDTNFFIIILLK